MFVGGTVAELPKRLEVLVLLFILANMAPVCCGRGCARLLPNREVEGCALVLPKREVEGCGLVLPNKLELCACGA